MFFFLSLVVVLREIKSDLFPGAAWHNAVFQFPNLQSGIKFGLVDAFAFGSCAHAAGEFRYHSPEPISGGWFFHKEKKVSGTNAAHLPCML